MRTTQIGTIALVQVAFTVAILASEVDGSPAVLLALHLALGALGVLVLTTRLPAPTFMVGLYALLVLDFAWSATIEEPLAAFAFVAAGLTALMPIMLYRGRWPVLTSYVIGAALCLAVAWVQPGWRRDLTVALATTILTMSAGAVVVMRAIRHFAEQADRVQKEAVEERRRTVGVRAATDAVTESGRVLHDTVINTLGAIASGASRARGAVRERCRYDLRRVETLLRTGADHAAPMWLFGFGGPEGFDVRRVGLTGDELRRYEALLPEAVTRALQGCVLEAVTNAMKHSGADHVVVDVHRRDRDLVVEVVDRGAGFDGQLVPHRGLAESVFARAAEHGIRVGLVTAPGSGTRVVLRCELSGATADAGPRPTNHAYSSVRGVRRRACWIWCLTIVAAGLLTETVNRSGDLTLAHLMLVIVGALGAATWRLCRADRDLPPWFTLALALVAPAMCLLALAAVQFGADRAYLFQAPGVTPLFAVLLVMTRDRRPLLLALAGLPVVVGVVLATRAPDDPAAAAMVAVLCAPIVALVVAWVVFWRQLGVIGARLADLWQQAVDARLERASVELSELARARWSAAGLQGSLALLRCIADGDLDPCDRRVQRRCGEQERYLRQITALTPDSALMSWWLALALAEAQAKAVRLRVQAGSVDLHDVSAAEAFGHVVLACLDTARPGSELVVSLIEHEGSPRLFVVGGGPLLAELPTAPRAVDRCEIRREDLGAQTLVEVLWLEAGAPAVAVAGAA